MVEPSDIDDLLEAHRFDEAEKLIDEAEPELRQELRDRIARRRDEADERARTLFDRINALGNDGRRADLVEIARDPATRSLIGLLADTPRRRARMRLDEAEQWAVNRQKTNERRLEEARRALDGLDLELARGLMNRIDGRFLSEELVAERDQLLLDISARTMELESVTETVEQLVEETEEDEDRPWWRRWLG